MLRWTEMFCDRRPLEPLVFPIISVAVHPLVHMITGFTNILLSTLGACNKVDNIGCLTTGVAPKLDYYPRRWLRDLRGGYYFAGFASCFAARSCLPKWFIITHVWFELGTYKKIPQTLGSSVGHGRSFCKDLAQCAGGLNDGPVFVNYFTHFWQVWVICQHEGENVWLGFKPVRK